MAQKRMFSLKIIDTDLFLDMPQSTQLLYFHLCMRADDDGFVGSPKRIMKMLGASDDDLRLLITKDFIKHFDTGILVIRDWRVHNTLKTDRKVDTQYKAELSQLTLIDGVYHDRELCGTSVEPECFQDGSGMVPQYRLGKGSIGKDRIDIGVASDDEPKGEESPPECKPKRKTFKPPTLEEVKGYCTERNNAVDAEYFMDFYTANGWKQKGGNPIKDWKATVRYWEKKSFRDQKQTKQNPALNYEQRKDNPEMDNLFDNL